MSRDIMTSGLMERRRWYNVSLVPSGGWAVEIDGVTVAGDTYEDLVRAVRRFMECAGIADDPVGVVHDRLLARHPEREIVWPAFGVG